jgi:hypothetical protein
MRIVTLLSAIQADIEQQITGLETCELHGGPIDLAELERIEVIAPAIYISLLGNPNLDNPNTGERDVELGLAAYVVTMDSDEQPRFEAAINLVESLLIHIPDNQWGQEGTFGAEQVTAGNFYSGAIDGYGVALWSVTWKQTIRLGESVWDAEGTFPTQLYLGLVSDVGSGHEDDYSLVAGGEV